MEKIRVVAYCRVSTDKEDQLNSLENQKRFFEDYIAKNSEWENCGIYIDEGISGTNIKKREAFKKMIREAKLGKFDKILTKDVSRFGRNVVDVLTYTRELKRNNVGVFFISENLDTSLPIGETVLTLMSAVAQSTSEDTSRKVKIGQKQRMKDGVVFGCNILGYDLENGKLEINKKEAEVIKLIFHKYLNENKGIHTIAKELCGEGVLTKRGNKEWTNASVYKILKNEKYCGDLVQQKTITIDVMSHEKKYNKVKENLIKIENHHEPIISKEMFNKVQEEMKKRREQFNIDGSKHSNRYAFSGKIVCPYCNSKYIGGDNRKRTDGTVRKTWKCYTKHKYGKVHITPNGEEIGCNNYNINDDVLKLAFIKVLKCLEINREKVIKDVERYVIKEIGKQCKKTDTEAELSKRKEKAEKAIDNLLDLYTEGKIKKERLNNKVEEYESEIQDLESKMQTIKEKEFIEKTKDDLVEEVKKVVKDIVNGKEFSDEVCKELVEKVVIKNKTEYDFYIKGKEGNFFCGNKSNILYNRLEQKN